MHNAKGVKSAHRKNLISFHQQEEETLQQKFRDIEKQLLTAEIIPLDKLCHFIEVGFQMSKNNFLAVTSYNELTYDSMARKYLFEF